MLKMSDTGNHNESSPIQLQIEKAQLPIELWESDVFGPEGDRNP